MGVPLRWLLGRSELRLRVLAAREQLDREVLWAHSIELADPVPWISGGELLLTTGLRLPAEADAQQKYVQRLADAGVAALGFGIGLSHDVVPADVVAAAEAAGLPLLEVPLPTPFAAVTKAVMQRLAEQQYEGVVQASRIQPRMTRAALHGGAQAVVRELAVSTGTAVLFLDHEGRTRAAHPAGVPAPAPDVLADLRAADEAAAAVSCGPDAGVAVQQVRVGPRVHGRLVLVTDRALTPVDHLLLGHAASLVALEAEKPLRLRDEQNRVNGLFVRMFLDGSIPAAAALSHLSEAGFPVRDGVRVLALRGGSPRHTLEAAGEQLSERGLPLFGTVREECAVLLLPGGHAMTAQAVMDRLDSRPRTRLWAGLSSPHDLADGPAALREALSAASAAQARSCRDVIRFEALAGHVLLTTPETRTVLASIARTRLAPLAAHDAANATELLGSLRAFLEHNGQWEAASASLGVHRHTLRNRMERAQSLLGVDLDSAHVRAELLLAFSAWQELDR
ncbi:PucR family transcriptional regulator [Streptomyces brasiliensis]|uniref:Regulatory protein n=1 Tax=Streptomyces brasiliensis TaxID=1954 RepID=A0A917NE99_9ACTN|nr:PucR family transcriptional regulator ligand-binding domain-containing protein [Streptomyces brasiliensis]GGI93710.1 putative regulatory protein [Streptomyces brasiliensis]